MVSTTAEHQPLQIIPRPPVRLDCDARRAWVGDHELQLAPKQYDLLSLFTANAGRVLTRRTIMRAVWGQERAIETRTVDVHVYRLRGLLGDDSRNPHYITTVHGIGFRWDGPLTTTPRDVSVVLKQLADDIRSLGDGYPTELFPADSRGGAIRDTAEKAARLAEQAVTTDGC